MAARQRLVQRNIIDIMADTNLVKKKIGRHLQQESDTVRVSSQHKGLRSRPQFDM